MAFNLNKQEIGSNAGSRQQESKPVNRFNLAKAEIPDNTAPTQTKAAAKWFVVLPVLLVAAGVGWMLLRSKNLGAGQNIPGAVQQKPAANQSTTPPGTAGVITPGDVPKGTAIEQTATTTTPIAPALEQLNHTIPVSFTKGSTAFGNTDETLIKKILAYLQTHPAATVHINGYASSEGRAAANQQLSLQRAITFKQHLSVQGINSNRITVTGMGTQNPIAPNDTEEGRQQNRRVEIVLQGE